LKVGSMRCGQSSPNTQDGRPKEAAMTDDIYSVICLGDDGTKSQAGLVLQPHLSKKILEMQEFREKRGPVKMIL